MKQIDPRKLEQARLDVGLKISEVVRLLIQRDFVVSAGSINNYESGFARPQPHVFAALCDVYNISNPFDLYSEVSHPEFFSTRKKLQLSS